MYTYPIISGYVKIFMLYLYECSSLGNYGEIIIKTPDEFWITGKMSNEREFFVIIQEKNANLKEISGEFYFNLFTYLS